MEEESREKEAEQGVSAVLVSWTFRAPPDALPIIWPFLKHVAKCI